MEATLIAIALGVWALLLKSFVPSYAAEKGKNLATKEDVSAITGEVEKVKTLYAGQLKELEHQNSLLLEELRSRNQLRMAALERRLDAHQHAFTLWRILLEKTHAGDSDHIVKECQQWWDRNCLYLSPKAREAFNKAYFAAVHYRVLVNSERPNLEMTDQYLRHVMEAGEAIVAGVELPTLGERESQSVYAVDAA